MLHRTHKPTARRIVAAHTAEPVTNLAERKPLRPSTISEACGSRPTTRVYRSGFAFDTPVALRKPALVRY